ncbi:hypothetical protein ACWEVD_17135 [Nocardia thailandica]|uniref:DUF732 domain-containing protein n=1 Tax=Nocardia thailandica TaxID=257275 RepID=A0ABW6PUV1_9NOCA|nr:hypothetical protein [Nocardia thailandica]
MSTGDAPEHKRRWIYVTAGVVLVVFALIGVFTFAGIHEDAKAHDKAEQLRQSLIQAGLPAPSADLLENSLGTDGGAVCQDPDAALTKARYQASITNGASGPGSRPVIGDNKVTQAVALTIAVYCPDELPGYLSHIDSLDLDDTTK